VRQFGSALRCSIEIVTSAGAAQKQQPWEEIFSQTGALAERVTGYRPRAGQLEMAQAIAAAIESQASLIVEAGTGTGKTFAYLVPALLIGGKVIVSTGTKTLQDQLFRKDLPTVRSALGAPVTIALLKGRANYVCHHHLERAKTSGRFAAREDARHLRSIVRFMQSTQSGDRGELADVPEGASIWPHVTSSRDNCLGSECTYYRDCFVMKARRDAQQADVVVVNHHLFFADVMLREEGVTDLLPSANTVIFDEAHQVPEVASLFFGQTVSSAQVLELTRDVLAEGLGAARDALDWPAAIAPLERAVRDLRLVFPQETTRLNVRQLAPSSTFVPGVQRALEELETLGRALEGQAQRSEGLERCWQRCRDLGARLARWTDLDDDDAVIRWIETHQHSLQLHETPLSVADAFTRQRSGQPRAWIFTSATLAVRNDFSHFSEQLGLSDALTHCWPSPFDYARQALLYIPSDLPDPGSGGYTDAVVEATLPVLRASGGRAFFLCTTWRALRLVAERLRAWLAVEGLDFPLLVQGEAGRSDLLERFRRYGNAILVGSQSFWEGVDVRGEALSLVIIDKLPFAPPDDPVLAARLEVLARAGGNPFMDYQLPAAVLSLKQGAGRLIRDENDRGVLMLCDPRLITKPYGRRIWQSLPAFARTRELADVEAFIARGRDSPDALLRDP
jgi:ATP-dependent DNA helicase DinG